MKMIKHIKYLILILGAVLFTNSCTEDPEFFAQESSSILLEELTITEIVLDGANPNNPAVSFNWNDGDFNQAVAESYSVEFSSTADFANAVEGTSTNGTSTVTMTMAQLNTAVGNAGLEPLVMQPVFVRVVTSLGVQNELAVPSNVITFNVTPFFNYIFNDVFLVGNATPSDWNNNANNPPLFRTVGDPDIYNYTGFFGGDAFFKVLEDRGAWAPQWGLGDTDNSLKLRPTEDDDDPPAMPVDGAGYYTLTVDIDALTYSLTPFDESGAIDYTSISVQGSGLQGDGTMSQLSFDSHIWYINSVTLSPGDLQFSTNLGSTWGGTSEFSGVATEGGDTIPVVVGDEYEVWFNDLTGEYIMIPLNL